MTDRRTQPDRREEPRVPKRGRRITDLTTHDEIFITVRQLADYCSVDYRTVRYEWIEKGALPAYNFHGKIRIKLVDAVDWVERNRLADAAPPHASDSRQ